MSFVGLKKCFVPQENKLNSVIFVLVQELEELFVVARGRGIGKCAGDIKSVKQLGSRELVWFGLTLVIGRLRLL